MTMTIQQHPTAPRRGLRDEGRLGRRGPRYSALANAAVKALEVELGIVLTAASIMASGRRLSWDDEDRLHVAHQHLYRIVAELKGLEVLA